MVLNAQIVAPGFNQYNWLDAVASSTFFEVVSPASAEGARSNFRQSSHILKASFQRPVEADIWSETERRDLGVGPSELVSFFIFTDGR